MHPGTSVSGRPEHEHVATIKLSPFKGHKNSAKIVGIWSLRFPFVMGRSLERMADREEQYCQPGVDAPKIED
jgi:hypothetical protein